MTRVRSESGAISILNVIIMLVLLIALGFAFELSAALDQQNAQTNDCSAARDATMASQNLLVAKNSDDPGLAIATAAVKSLRANGFNGEVEVWFYEAPSSAVPQSKRAWAWGIQTKSSLKGYFATYSLGDFNIPMRERHGDRRIRVTESIPSKPVRTPPNTRSSRPQKSFRKK